MNKYDILFNSHKDILNENAKLKKENETLTAQRKAMSHELINAGERGNAINAVFEAFSNNLVKSLKAKNIVNMNGEELEAINRMTEHYIDFVDLLKSYELEAIDLIR